jgi:hypothetical protein
MFSDQAILFGGFIFLSLFAMLGFAAFYARQSIVINPGRKTFWREFARAFVGFGLLVAIVLLVAFLKSDGILP